MKKFLNTCILALMLTTVLPVHAHAARLLVPVGQVVGLQLENQTVTVAAFDDNADARPQGLQIGDQILTIDGKAVTCAEDVRQALQRSDGTVDVHVRRGSRETRLHLTPQITADGPKLGIFLREGVTGIGTVTYYDPQSKRFGTLGHGVNDEAGSLLAMTGGNAYPAQVMSVRKGRSGHPGQLVGSLLASTPFGTLAKNTEKGVFGYADSPFQGEALPVGSAETVQTGQAHIYSTVAGEQVQEYSVEILKIYPKSRSNGRNMLIKVTDPALLQATGGIVQGMSGSPIIQDGKLIGAVTHVLVNDPTTGYGIFIENMLEAAA